MVTHTWQDEILAHLTIAWPVCVTFILRKSMDIISVIFVGHLGALYLSAAGLATVTSNVTGYSMIIGFAGAMSTICSQAFGAKDFVTMGLTLQRAILILMVCICLPVSILWLYSARIMVNLGQQPDISMLAQNYLMGMMPGLWCLSCSICIQNYLHAQSKTRPVALIQSGIAILHPIWCYIFVFYLKYGYIGAAMAISTSKILELLALLCYLNFFSTILTDTNFKFDLVRCWQEWPYFMKLGLPNLLMMCEWWASEIIVFMAGTLQNPDIQVSSMSVYQNTVSACFMIPSSLHVATSTRIGNALGANDPIVAARATVVGPTLACIASCMTGACLFVWGRRWCMLFTDDVVVINTVQLLLPILCLYTVADGVQSALTGVLKGVGKQWMGGPVVLFSYYVIGLPLAYYLALTRRMHMGIAGLCIGTTVGTWVHVGLYVIIAARVDWVEEAKICNNNMKLAAVQGQALGGTEAKSNSQTITLILPSSSNSSSPLPNTESTRYAPREIVRHVWTALHNSWVSIFGGERVISEYELVQQYTMDLSQHEDNDDDIELK